MEALKRFVRDEKGLETVEYAIILGLIGGAAIGGFWGVLLAVPVMAIIKIISGHLWRTRVLGQDWEEASAGVIEERLAPDTIVTRIRSGRGGGARSRDESGSDAWDQTN